jgi:hypothetical protein
METTKELGLDAYARRARLIPGLLVVLPLGLAIIAWFPADRQAWGVATGLIVAAGGTVLLAHVARVFGKRIEPGLLASWGGSPAMAALRHSGTANSVIRARRHTQLAKISPDMQVPTAAQEARDPATADALYEAHVKVLIAKTRDTKRFALLFEENCNYGFWRNLLGLRPFGIAFSALGCLSLLVLVLSGRSTISLAPVVASVANLALLGSWIFLIGEEPVRTHSQTYAERLLEACEELAQ